MSAVDTDADASRSDALPSDPPPSDSPEAAASLTGPLATYRAWRESGRLQYDPAQELAAEKLQSLHNALRHYKPDMGRTGWKARLGLARRRHEPPQGLYLFGGVGRGKSMLMDAFAETAPVARKRRVHFHAFMSDVHERLHAWRQARGKQDADPVPGIARELASEAWLLCFDEFHVVNIADAMILSRLFEGLFDHGVVVVATSNFPPDKLYEGGLQRERFTPFIEVLKRRLDILQLDGGVDYRLAQLTRMPTFHTPLGPAARQAMDAAFARLTEGAEVGRGDLHIKGRRLPVPASARGVARVDFATLCREARGAEDYAALAARFHTLVLDEVPVMDESRRNEARRFMTLIDTLYEHRCNLVVSADAPPDRLYAGHDGAFEFQRTVSRLSEMQTPDYIALEHA
jgi:cell division protein ZapE